MKVFKDVGFNFPIVTHLKYVDFLNIKLISIMSQVNTCLNQMIQKSSNQPTQIIDQLPRIVSDRLSKNYSNGEIFSASKT